MNNSFQHWSVCLQCNSLVERSAHLSFVTVLAQQIVPLSNNFCFLGLLSRGKLFAFQEKMVPSVCARRPRHCTAAVLALEFRLHMLEFFKSRSCYGLAAVGFCVQRTPVVLRPAAIRNSRWHLFLLNRSIAIEQTQYRVRLRAHGGRLR